MMAVKLEMSWDDSCFSRSASEKCKVGYRLLSAAVQSVLPPPAMLADPFWYMHKRVWISISTLLSSSYFCCYVLKYHFQDIATVKLPAVYTPLHLFPHWLWGLPSLFLRVVASCRRGLRRVWPYTSLYHLESDSLTSSKNVSYLSVNPRCCCRCSLWVLLRVA